MHARLIISVRTSGRPSVSVSVSVSQSVFLFIRTCQLEELWTTFCDILYVPHVSGEDFISVVFNSLQCVINE